MMVWWQLALTGGTFLVAILLPPKYDPAIRWKERNESKRKK